MDRPTIIDVAQLAGVSEKTVSRAINNSPLLSKATRENVERIIAETGFVPNPPARALALKRNFLIALVHDNALTPTLVEVQAGMLAAIKGS
jgi:LacI family transcriptional regulator